MTKKSFHNDKINSSKEHNFLKYIMAFKHSGKRMKTQCRVCEKVFMSDRYEKRYVSGI
jgi:hypothetical protein